MQNSTNAADLTLTLTPEEVALLEDLLSNDLQNLRSELHKTEDYDWRQELKRREATMRGLLDRLGAGRPSDANHAAATA